MTGRRLFTENTPAVATPPCSQTDQSVPSAGACQALSQWRNDRLIEARSILADFVHHPDSLVVLACRAVQSISTDRRERSDALGLLHILNVTVSGSSTAAARRAAS